VFLPVGTGGLVNGLLKGSDALSLPFEVTVPRGLIMAYGVGCALLALLLSPPRQRPCHQKGVDAASDWAATWNGPCPAAARS